MTGKYYIIKHPYGKSFDRILVVTHKDEDWHKFKFHKNSIGTVKRDEYEKDWNKVMKIVRLARKEMNVESIEVNEHIGEISSGYRIVIRRKVQQSMWESVKEK
jgi:hypothetical protein